MKLRGDGPDGQAGQSMVLFTLMIAVFIGFCALVVDVGRVYAERRYMQNAADAGVMAATGLISASLMPCDAVHETDDVVDGVCSGITMAEAVQKARTHVNANASLLGGYTAPVTMVVRYARYNATAGRCGTNWLTMAESTARVPGDTCKVRVEATSHWTTWFPLGMGADFTTRAAAAGASATAMIVGDNSLEARAGVWPMVRRRSALDPYGQASNRESPFTFWSSNTSHWMDKTGGSFKAQIGLALNSNRSPWSTSTAPKNQTLEGSMLYLANPRQADAWDGGQWFGLSKLDLSGRGNPSWDTRGNNPSVGANFALEDQFVDLGNWYRQGYGGKISLTSDWSTRTCGGVNCQIPTAAQFIDPSNHYDLSVTGNNGNTTSSTWWRTTGDWVETYQGDLGSNMKDSIEGYIDEYATDNTEDCPFTARWGKCVVIAVYLWEGAQEYTGGVWSAWKDKEYPDRVHIVDFWYFAFYEGIVEGDSSSEVRGFFVAKSEDGTPPIPTVRPSNHYNYYFPISE